MNDEQMAPVLRAWLRQRDVPPVDPVRTAAQVGARLPRVRQRRRWPPLPSLGRRRDTFARGQVSGKHSNGAPIDHVPAVTGTTRTVLDPVKAITAAALVIAVGAAFLVAQPFGRSGGDAPTAAQDVGVMLPTEVTGTYQGHSCQYGDGEIDGQVRTSVRICTVRNEWSDPRLQGTETYRDSGASYLGDEGVYIGHFVHDIETDEGAWRMRPQFRFESVGEDGPANYSGTWILDGEGAYEGLSAVLHKPVEVTGPLRGFIVSTALLPPAPDAASTE
jgi:hypothetical protein